MLKIEDNNKLSIVQHDNGILHFKLDNMALTDGDKVYFLVKKNLDQDHYDIEIMVNTFDEKGEADIFITEQNTSIEAGSYRYAICVHLNEGLISTVITGKFKIIGGVHHE